MARSKQQRRRRVPRRKVDTLSRKVDRLSDLPDSVICHILSFLPTEDSVTTSVLGKRWRHLWSYVPTLHFSWPKPDLIDRVMSLHQVPNIVTFRLHGALIKYSGRQIERWMTFAAESNVQNLDLCFIPYKAALPRFVFTACKTLVDLRLESCGPIPTSGSVCLPRLKRLHLIRVLYQADESLPHLISGCPVLEELEIESSNLVSLTISSLTLKSLCLDIHGLLPDHDYRLEINTPALVYLKICDRLPQHIESAGPLTSLVEADILLCNSYKKQDDLLYSRWVLEFIDILRHVKCLKLSLLSFTTIVDSAFSTPAVSFNNLTKLDLTSDWRFLSKFLTSADNLEILIYSEAANAGTGRMMELPQPVPACILSSLRVIKLPWIRGAKYQLEMIRYFMMNAMVLERMEITYQQLFDSKKKARMQREISTFQRGSKNIVHEQLPVGNEKGFSYYE